MEDLLILQELLKELDRMIIQLQIHIVNLLLMFHHILQLMRVIKY